ncbi:MAG: GtrA family protein [Candidatus Azambacteria bacterium]|nr:GtrA family protein [Candidatus Azambacteria bacterium]
MKDFYLVTVIGLAVGALFLLPLKGVGFSLTPWIVIGSLVGFTLLAPLAFGVFRFLSRFWRPMEQIGKFAAVGTLNSLFDLAIVNFLILLTGVTAGWLFSLFKALSFFMASANSYAWNKFWTFQSRSPADWREYSYFIFFTLLSVFLNVVAASFVVDFLGAPVGIGLELWANIGALTATAVSLTFNFFLYKKVVFKAK